MKHVKIINSNDPKFPIRLEFWDGNMLLCVEETGMITNDIAFKIKTFIIIVS